MENPYDKRVLERNIQNKSITLAEYEAYLKKLKDLKNECEDVELKNEE